MLLRIPLQSLFLCAAVVAVHGFQQHQQQQQSLRPATTLAAGSSSRRDYLESIFAAVVAGGSIFMNPLPAHAVADCFQDCTKNCNKIAPKNPDYCVLSCKEYCEQDDRTDGLSGSVSAASGEVGLLGGTFGQGTVPKGEDRPPSITLPGLDFGSDKGKKLIGY